MLLLAYPRTGSSFTASMLTASRYSSYFFEPLYNMYHKGGLVEEAEAGGAAARAVGRLVTGLLDCDPSALRYLRRVSGGGFAIARRGAFECRLLASPRLVKTIRLHGEGLEPWIYGRGDVKVVHLVRDPRSIFSSVYRLRGSFAEMLDPVDLCEKMLKDLELERKLSKDRYLRSQLLL